MTLTSRQKTEIVERLNREMHERIAERAAQVNKDGHLIGTKELPGPARLDWYFSVDPATGMPRIMIEDYFKALDPNWESWIRQGIDPGPASPYLKGLLRVPGLFKKVTQDFTRLSAQFGDRYTEPEI